MNLSILQQARVDGVVLSVSQTGSIRARGNPDAVGRWLPLIRENKADLLTALEAQESAQWLADAAELDGLICRLCTMAKFSDAARNRMLDARKRMAPMMLKNELDYFRQQVAKADAGTYWENQE